MSQVQKEAMLQVPRNANANVAVVYLGDPWKNMYLIRKNVGGERWDRTVI